MNVLSLPALENTIVPSVDTYKKQIQRPIIINFKKVTWNIQPQAQGLSGYKALDMTDHTLMILALPGLIQPYFYLQLSPSFLVTLASWLFLKLLCFLPVYSDVTFSRRPFKNN